MVLEQILGDKREGMEDNGKQDWAASPNGLSRISCASLVKFINLNIIQLGWYIWCIL